jgi:hypothetical protein
VSPRLPPDLRVDAPLFDVLWALHPAKFGTIKIAGKQIATPRWTQSYGESYTFSNETHDALPLATHPFFEHLQKRVSDVCGCAYTQMLVNWYADVFRHTRRARLVVRRHAARRCFPARSSLTHADPLSGFPFRLSHDLVVTRPSRVGGGRGRCVSARTHFASGKKFCNRREREREREREQGLWTTG